MILFRAQNMVEVVGIPEYFVEELGQLQIIGANMRMTWCSVSEVGGAQMLVPRYETVRPVAGFRSLVLDMERLLAQLPALEKLVSPQHH